MKWHRELLDEDDLAIGDFEAFAGGGFASLEVERTMRMLSRKVGLDCFERFGHGEVGGQEVVNLLETGGIVGDGMAVGEILDEVGVDVELGELVLEGVDLCAVIGVVGGIVKEKGGSGRGRGAKIGATLPFPIFSMG